MSTALCYTHPVMRLHQNCTPGHPEAPERLSAALSGVLSVTPDIEVREPPLATVEQVERVHAPGYVQALSTWVPEAGCRLLDEDTGLSPHSLSAARYAAGALCDAVAAGLENGVRRIFSISRPPGHHAEPKQPMGFCLINSVAVGAYEAIEHFGVSRVAIVDFDVHHGNGTEAMVARDERIRFYSSFQHPYYPFKGVPPLGENCISTPLPAGTTGVDYRKAIAFWWDELLQWRPELMLVSAGFDAHVQDPLANLLLTAEDFYWLGEQLSHLANTLDCPLISTLEGGYHLKALEESVGAYWQAQV